MNEEFDKSIKRYQHLVQAGCTELEAYGSVRQDGLTILEASRLVLHLYGLPLQEIKRIKDQVDGYGSGMQPMKTENELCRVLREELGCCDEEPVLLLRDTLQLLKVRSYSDNAEDLQRKIKPVLERLNYQQNPGLAIWFLSVLRQRDMVWDVVPIEFCCISPKGLWILDGIERLYVVSADIRPDRLS